MEADPVGFNERHADPSVFGWRLYGPSPALSAMADDGELY
jgi:hypothetical protein